VRKITEYCPVTLSLPYLLAVVALFTTALSPSVKAEPRPASVEQTPSRDSWNDPFGNRAPRTLKEAGIPTTEIIGQPADLTAQNATPDPDPAPSTAVPYSTIPAQVGGSFTSGPGAGYDRSFVGLDGFVPLMQTPGKDLAYVQGRLLLSTDGGNPGGNVLVGYRRFNPASNSILGGYLGFDVRDTGRTTFSQLGAGVEGVWSKFEARLNGYLPVGDTRRTVDSTSSLFSSGGGTSEFRFQGNSLLSVISNPTITRITNKRDQAALGGFDAEAGVKLAQWSPDGNLKSYLGLYYYSGSNVGGFVGIRGRLAANITKNFSAGLSVQGDPEFGTTAAVTVGFSFPGVSSSTSETQVDPAQERSNWARMAESPSRTNTVAVTERTQTESTILQSGGTTAVVALNPATNQPYVFQHVVLGAGGNGTFESPFGTVINGINAAASDGNAIVYVQPGSNPGIPAFTIKDGVQVLSTGPVQTLPTSQFGTVQLPLSGAGILPNVTGTVTMGNNTVLSGFAVTPPASNRGIVAIGVQNVTIRDNQVQATGDDTAGIVLQNVAGTATVSNNTVRTTGNTTFPGIPSGAYGIGVDANNTALSTLTLTNNTVTTSGFGAFGIYVRAANNSAISSLSLSNNSVTTSGANAHGIFVIPSDNSSIASLSLSNNTFTTSGANAVGIFVPPDINSSIASLSLSNNTVTTSGVGAFGIYVRAANNSAIASLSLSNNSVTTSGSGAYGIYVLPVFNSLIASISLSNNRIPQSGSDNVIIFNPGNQPICANITGNLAQNPGGGGTNFRLISGGQPFRVINLLTLSATNNGGTFLYDGAGVPGVNYFNVPSCP
jgi:hypothetical protein